MRLFCNRSQKTSKCGKNISDTLLSPRVPLFCSYNILTSSVIYYWTDARQHGIYLLNRNTEYMLPISFRKHREEEKENNLLTLSVKM